MCLCLSVCRWMEQDPEEIYQSVLTCMKGVGVASQSCDLAELKGVGITNQRETTILWDCKTGECLYNAIVWCDGRTSEVVDTLLQSASKDELRVSADSIVYSVEWPGK